MAHWGWLDRVKPYHPIVAVLVTPPLCLLLITTIHWKSLGDQPWKLPALFAWVLLGIAYTHFFEYSYHRFLMHAGARWLGFIKRNHLEHHRVFNGANFTSKNQNDWQYIASPWYVFPVLFSIHYAALGVLLPAKLMVSFFCGVVFHYLFFELTHWLTHVEGNVVDEWLRRVRLVGAARDYHIRHHRYHHEIPTMDFNFNPPFLGDVIAGTLKVPPRAASGTRAVPLESGHTR